MTGENYDEILDVLVFGSPLPQRTQSRTFLLYTTTAAYSTSQCSISCAERKGLEDVRAGFKVTCVATA